MTSNDDFLTSTIRFLQITTSKSQLFDYMTSNNKVSLNYDIKKMTFWRQQQDFFKLRHLKDAFFTSTTRFLPIHQFKWLFVSNKSKFIRKKWHIKDVFGRHY